MSPLRFNPLVQKIGFQKAEMFQIFLQHDLKVFLFDIEWTERQDRADANDK